LYFELRFSTNTIIQIIAKIYNFNPQIYGENIIIIKLFPLNLVFKEIIKVNIN